MYGAPYFSTFIVFRISHRQVFESKIKEEAKKSFHIFFLQSHNMCDCAWIPSCSALVLFNRETWKNAFRQDRHFHWIILVKQSYLIYLVLSPWVFNTLTFRFYIWFMHLIFQMILKPEITAANCRQQYIKWISFVEPIWSAQYLDRIWGFFFFRFLMDTNIMIWCRIIAVHYWGCSKNRKKTR